MKLIVDGKPIPQQRHRIRRIGKIVTTYDPLHSLKKIVRQKLIVAIRKAFDSESKRDVIEVSNLVRAQSYSIEFAFYLPICKSDSAWLQNFKQWNLVPMDKKPDFDNLEKFYLDCGKGILYQDDSMVVECKSKKRFSKNPRTEINITPRKQMVLHKHAEIVFKNIDPENLWKLSNFAHDISTLLPDQKVIEEMVEEVANEEMHRHFEYLGDLLFRFASEYADVLMKIKRGVKNEKP